MMDIAKLHNLAISGTGFIFDPVTGNSYNTNETGLLIVNAIKAGKSISEIANMIATEYDVSIEIAEQDILQIIESLRSDYLI
jgi:butyrate kinase